MSAEHEHRERDRVYGDAKLLVSVDFGTFGCAVAYCSPGAPGSLKIVKHLFSVSNDMNASPMLYQRDGEKMLSALLLEKGADGRDDVVAIGYQAQQLYQEYKRNQQVSNQINQNSDQMDSKSDELNEISNETSKTSNKSNQKYLYFEHFKKHLYNKEDRIHKNMRILAADCDDSDDLDETYEMDAKEKEENSRSLMELIEIILRKLCDTALLRINDERVAGKKSELSKDDVFWVVTIPAIWDEMCKEVMRHCVRRTGIKYFELALEPVAATFCVLNRKKEINMKQLKLKTGQKFIVLDCGGGTIDASCIEVTHRTKDATDLKELHYGDGIFKGGLDVDDKFIQTLNQLLSNTIFDPNPSETTSNAKKESDANESKSSETMETLEKSQTPKKSKNSAEKPKLSNDGKVNISGRKRWIVNAKQALRNGTIIVEQRRNFTTARCSLRKGQGTNVQLAAGISQPLVELLKKQRRIQTKRRQKLRNSKNKNKNKSKDDAKDSKSKPLPFDEINNQIKRFTVEYKEFDPQRKQQCIQNEREKRQKREEIEFSDLMSRTFSIPSDSEVCDEDILFPRRHGRPLFFYNPTKFWSNRSCSSSPSSSSSISNNSNTVNSSTLNSSSSSSSPSSSAAPLNTLNSSHCSSSDVDDVEPVFWLNPSGQFLHVSEVGWKYLHSEICGDISLFLFKLLSNISLPIRDVILVGGFSNSLLLQQQLECDFPGLNFLKILRPQMACVEGALYWICQKTRMKKVRSKYSFGLKHDEVFNFGIHEQMSHLKKKICINEKTGEMQTIMPDVMKWFTKVNKEMPPYWKEMYQGFGFLKHQDQLDIELYATQDEKARYSFEENVFMVKRWTIKDLAKVFGMDGKGAKGEDKDEKAIVPIQMELEFRDYSVNLYVCDMNGRRVSEAITVDDKEVEKIIGNKQVRVV